MSSIIQSVYTSGYCAAVFINSQLFTAVCYCRVPHHSRVIVHMHTGLLLGILINVLLSSLVCSLGDVSHNQWVIKACIIINKEQTADFAAA